MISGSRVRLLWGSVVVVVAALTSHAALAQVDCLRSLKITKPTATIPGYPWLPGSTPGQAPLSCLAAETFRERVYVENKPLIDGAMLANREAFLARATADVAATEKAIGDLEAKIQANEKKQVLLLAVELVIATSGRNTVVACLALRSPAGLPACAAVVTGMVIAIAHMLSGNMAENEYATAAATARQDLAKVKAQLASLRSTLKDGDMPAVQQATVSMFGGLCRAVQQNCM